MLGGDVDGSFSDAGSRWGIKGSTEVSEGLTAVYKFETRVNTSSKDPNQSTKQMYAGLSGGFGSLTLGKFHNAAQNHSGGIRDIGYWYSSGDAPTNTGNTVSYAFSSDAASFQLDAIMDGGIDTGKSIDQVQFGMSVNLGDIGKVALGYVEVENTVMPASMADPKEMPAMKDEDPMDDPMDDAPTMVQKTNPDVVVLTIDGTATRFNSGTLTIWSYKEVEVDSTSKKRSETPAVEVYAVSGAKSYHTAPMMEPTDPNNVQTDPGKVADTFATVTDADRGVEVEADGYNTGIVVIGDDTYGAGKLKRYKRTDAENEKTYAYEVVAPTTYYAVEGGTLVSVMLTGSHSESVLAPVNDGSGSADAGDDMDDTAGAGDDMDDGSAGAGDDMDDGSAGAGDDMDDGSAPAADGYTSTHVSVQLNLGAVTLGLGYSEKESNAKGSMDEKTTYVGASGSIGDTGMGWRAWTRDISNSGNEKGDRNPWGIGINKDLGGGAFTFVEHHNADNDKSGNTIIALGVNF